MAAGRKAPPWRQGKDGARKRRRRRLRNHAAKARQILFAASPLLLLVVGCLSSLSMGVVAAEAGTQAGAGRGTLGGRSFGQWMSSGGDEFIGEGGIFFRRIGRERSLASPPKILS